MLPDIWQELSTNGFHLLVQCTIQQVILKNKKICTIKNYNYKIIQTAVCIFLLLF